MWGAPAESPWSPEGVVTKRASHKWHIVNEESLEKRTWIIKNWRSNFVISNVWFGVLNCGDTVHPYLRELRDWEKQYPKYISELNEDGLLDLRGPLVLKDKIKLSQANICAICKRAKMRQLDLQNVEI